MDTSNEPKKGKKYRVTRKKETDSILLAAKSLLKRRRQDSMASFLSHIEIRHVNYDESRHLPALREEDGENASYYTISHSTQPGLRSYTVPIRWENGSPWKCRYLIWPNRFVDSDRLEVKFNRVWRNLRDWVATLPENAPTHVGEAGFRMQSNWWANNGRHFRILDLPQELRLAILGRAIGMDIYPDLKTVSRQEAIETVIATLGNGYTPPEIWPGTARRADMIDAPNYNLLLVSKGIYKNCKKAAFLSHISFTQTKHTEMLSLLTAPTTPIPNALTHIGLSFSMIEYIFFFGVRVKPWSDEGKIQSPPPAMTILSQANIPNLKRLGIKFPSPIYGQFTDPWARRKALDDPHVLMRYLPMACHKVLVDWIMIFAKASVEHIPQVYLEGYVKTSVKAKWVAIFEAQKQGSYVDVSEDLKAIETTPLSSLPPQCTCTSPCDSGAVNKITTPEEWCGHGPGDSCRCWVHLLAEERAKEPRKVLRNYEFHFED